MNHGSLFSGIGGFDLAAEWMGWNNIFSCEINPFGRKVLQHYWPNTKHYEDINKTDFTIHRGGIDILTGGFPCQPFSLAGKRKGTEDDRHLWPRMLEVIREVQPSWVVGENVYGLINWDGGLVFDQIQADLEAEGYEVQPVILPAVSVNAPHRRDRIWFVAYSDNARRAGQESDSRTKVNRGKAGRIDKFIKIEPTPNTDNARAGNTLRNNGNRKKKNEGWKKFPQSEFRENSRTTPNTDNQGLQRSQKQRSATKGRENGKQQPAGFIQPDWENFPTQSPICGRNDGVSNRVDRIKALGNAIVPQVAYEIFKTINNYELQTRILRPEAG